MAKGVRLKPLQTAGDTVTPLDLRRFHEGVQAAFDMLQSALVRANEIAKGAVGESAIADGSIFDKHVAAGAGVNGSKLGAGSVNRDRIVPNTLTNAEIDPAANIQGSKLLASSVNADRMNTVAGGSTGLTTAHLAPAAGLLGTQIANTTIDALNIKNNTITKNQILAKTLTHNELDDSAGILGTQLDAAAGIVDGQINSLNGSKLTAGSVTPAKLSAFLRSGFLYKLAADSGVINSYTALTFATQVYDALGQRAGANFIPNQSGTWEWTARLRLEDGDVVPGYGISVAILDVTAGTVLYTSPAKQAFSDPAPAGGSAIGTAVNACIAELDWSIPVVAGNSYAIAFVFVKDIHFNTSLASWGAVLGQANAKADYTNAHVASVQIAGSYVRVRPVIQ